MEDFDTLSQRNIVCWFQFSLWVEEEGIAWHQGSSLHTALKHMFLRFDSGVPTAHGAGRPLRDHFLRRWGPLTQATKEWCPARLGSRRWQKGSLHGAFDCMFESN